MTARELRMMLLGFGDEEVTLFMGPPFWSGPINRINPIHGTNERGFSSITGVELQCLIGPTPCPDRVPGPVEPMGMMVAEVPVRRESNWSLLKREEVSGEMDRMRRERDEARDVARTYWNAVDSWKPDAFSHRPCPDPHWLGKD